MLSMQFALRWNTHISILFIRPWNVIMENKLVLKFMIISNYIHIGTIMCISSVIPHIQHNIHLDGNLNNVHKTSFYLEIIKLLLVSNWLWICQALNSADDSLVSSLVATAVICVNLVISSNDTRTAVSQVLFFIETTRANPQWSWCVVILHKHGCHC